MLAIPDKTVSLTKLADWVELCALSSPDGIFLFGSLVSALDLSKEDQLEDIAEDDTLDETLVLSAQAEIRRRRNIIGSGYPFRINETGKSIHVVAEISDAGVAYLLCLFLSHASDRTIVPKKLAPLITNEVRDLFQACSTVAAGGFVEGPAISFGWPRPNRTNFLKALHEAYKQFGDGTPVKRPRPAASKSIKDNGIDVIAWRSPVDGLSGTIYFLGQVASGEDWKDKSVVTDSNHFHKYWFERAPASSHQDAMFMPFCLEPEDADPAASYEDVLKDHMQSLGYRYGNVFYRYRVAHFVERGMHLHAEGKQIFERAKDFPKISSWVSSYRDKLSAA
jgi:hypothetical protein